jgi:hypothetical protein
MRPEFFSQFSLTNEKPICLGLLCEIVQAYWTVMGEHYIKKIQVYGYPEYDWIVDTLQELAVRSEPQTARHFMGDEKIEDAYK